MAETGGGEKIRVAALGDLHVSEDAGLRYGEMFAEISERADVLVLCGDLTNLGTRREASLLAKDLESLTIPVVGVLGNHDVESGKAEEVRRLLADAGVAFVEGRGRTVRGIGFAGVRGFGGGFGRGMLSSFGEPTVKQFVAEAVAEAVRLEEALWSLKTERTVVVLHYAPIVGTVEGEPREIFPFLGNSRLAETIDRFPVTAVFHGHAHHGTYQGRTAKGVPVYNCAAPVAKPTGRAYALIEV
ncbi:MAG TPA: metallophosphoesterase [Azospirillaceae bacterium]|nr:metallophosphoesterase [Azospirillaceae bacterium]